MGCGSSTTSAQTSQIHRSSQFTSSADSTEVNKKNSAQTAALNTQTPQLNKPTELATSWDKQQEKSKKSLPPTTLNGHASQLNKPTTLVAPSNGSKQNPQKTTSPEVKSLTNQKLEINKPNQLVPTLGGPKKGKKADNVAFALNNAAAFKSDGKKSKPINYASPTINDDTLAILNSMKDKNEMAGILCELYNPGKSFSFNGLDDTYMRKLSEEYANLCEHALDEMCSAQDFNTRVKWQTFFLHLIQATYQSQFGDFAFSKVKKKADILREKHPIGNGEVDPTLEGLNGIDYPKGVKDAKLWDFVEFLKEDRYKMTRKDLEYITRKGEVAIPSEIGAIADVCNYVQTIKTQFHEDLEKVFSRSNEYKSNAKGLLRAVFKMDEYATKKPRPSFNYIWDLIRCKAVYPDIKSLREDFKTLVSKYKVIQVKDKLQTALKNLTINIVYDRVIAEVQMVYGEVIGEYSNHKIYEVYRCESIQEVHNTVLAWSDYRFEEFKPLCGAILPTRSLESQTFRTVFQKMKYSVMKSKEYGIFTRESVSICEDNNGFMAYIPVQRLRCYYDSNNIYNITLQDTEQLRSGVEVLSKKLKDGNYIKNVTGSYHKKTGIKKLVLHFINDETITLGRSVPDEVTFDVKIPKHCVVLGFSYRGNETSGIQSMYCWFGHIPLDDPYAIQIANKATTNYGLPVQCINCTRQLIWYPNQDNELECSQCCCSIPQKSGAARCLKDPYTLCSSCLYQKNSALLSLPNPTKLTCKSSHELKWQYTGKSSQFICAGCKVQFSSTSGSYTCPCNIQICSGCCQAKENLANIIEMATFPTVSTDLPCGLCNRALTWYWHAKLYGYPESFSCSICIDTYPGSSGNFHCDKCEYDVCSKCYYDSGQSDVSTMPNFRNKLCTKGLYLTWQFSLPQEWECQTCKATFPAGSGCYACPSQHCDNYKECSGCYLAEVTNFTYKELTVPYVSEAMVDLVAPFGQYKAGLDCFDCGRPLVWLWDRKWGQFNDNEDTESMSAFYCSIHRGEVSINAGSFFCLNCDYDICSMCYKEEKGTKLTYIPNLSRSRCAKGSLLGWNYDMPNNWTCAECETIFKDPLGGYTCSAKDSICCGDYYICPVCFIKTCKYNEQQFLNKKKAILSGEQPQVVKKSKCSKCGTCGEPLKWRWDTAESGPGYESGAICSICESNFPHNSGVYNCAKCQFDACTSCYEAPPERNDAAQFVTEKVCPFNKKLIWIPSAGDNWSCDLCETQMPPNTGYFACEDPTSCECGGYAECALCVHSVQKEEKKNESCTKCGSCSGKLQWHWDTRSIKATYSNGASCSICGESIPHNAGIYNCKSCEYDVCSSCFKYPDNTLFGVKRLCPNQSKLLWRHSSGGDWSCDICKSNMPPNSGFFACLNYQYCKCGGYAECAACAKTEEKREESGRTKCALCDKGLKWNWDTGDIHPSYAPGAICSYCRNFLPHNAGIYNCKSCEFDICSLCYKSPDLTQFKTQRVCPNKEKLIWRPSAGGEWSCDVCQAEMPPNAGAFQCKNPENCGCGYYAECAACARPKQGNNKK